MNQALLSSVTITSKDSESILRCMREHGICIIPRYYSSKFTDKIRKECEERVNIKEDTNFADGSYKRFDSYKGTSAASNERVYHVDCFSSEAEQFKHDTFLKEIGSQYYGSPHSVHVCIYERHRHNTIPVRGFHIDTFELSTYKVFLYLNDVDIHNGPTSYIVDTHKLEELRRMKKDVWGPAVSPGDPSGKAHPFNFTDKELSPWLDKHVAVTAPKGSVVLFDTWGVHKGITPEPGKERHTLVNYYRKGANLPRSDFGFDVNADYERYAQNYKQYIS